ncbi:hypothetical protein OB905_02320 [Halobacteria archaeon AArc-dxtr1]|nr:hypothetical protein [Halobacteria archaeon AArc-dxtr1]
MSQRIDDADSALRDTLYRCLSHPYRRRILATVTETESVVETETLASQLEETNADDAAATGHVAIRTALVHVHLPMLDEADLVDWNRDAGSVSGGNRLPADESSESSRAGSETDWEVIASTLSKRRNQLVLSVVSEASDQIESKTIARQVTQRERSEGKQSISAEEVHISLHHHHLPALDDAGLIEYDSETHSVTYRNHPYVEDAWFQVDVDSSQRSGPALVRAPL